MIIRVEHKLLLFTPRPDFFEDDDGRGPHRSDLCEMCMKLGHSCR